MSPSDMFSKECLAFYFKSDFCQKNSILLILCGFLWRLPNRKNAVITADAAQRSTEKGEILF